MLLFVFTYPSFGFGVVTILFPPHSSSGASVVAIDNKIEQAMVSPNASKSHIF